MNATVQSLNEIGPSRRLLSIHEAMTYLGLGRNATLSFLAKANARVPVGGRRALYDVRKIDYFLDQVSSGSSEGGNDE